MANVQLKIASASTNQTVMNFTRNVPNILAAIDRAVEDGADVLSLQELGLTGYTADDYFKWIHPELQQVTMLDLVQYIADYANKRNPNLVVSLGFPFFHADKSEPVKINIGTEDRPAWVDNPIYNIGNKPFNAVATISGGKLHAISAKSLQPDGPAEFEQRQLGSWPDYLGVRDITLPTGQIVPFGKVVVQLGEGKDRCSIYHEICAEGWPGLRDDGTVDEKEMREGRYLNRVAEQQDISLVINPSASKPEPFLDKTKLRTKLCETGSSITGGAYVYTNCLGLEAAPVAFEGGSIFANNGEIAHRGERYSMEEMLYSSADMDVPIPERGKPDVVIPHVFSEQKGVIVGGPAAWETLEGQPRGYEEISRNITLWLRDYLAKNRQQGYFISLSGGQDSAFGAVMVAQMIDLGIAQMRKKYATDEEAIGAFIDQFEQLDYGDKVRAIARKDGEAAIDYLKGRMLTCTYMPGENSSKYTEDAARFLIEGGQMVEVKDREGNAKKLYFDPVRDRVEGDRFVKSLGEGNEEIFQFVKLHDRVKGIGGTFHVMNVQPIIDSYMETYAGLEPDLTPEKHAEARRQMKAFIGDSKNEMSPEISKLFARRIPSWSNKSDDILLQNIQARARLPVAWLFGNDEHKIACVTSNWSEAVAGYWTFGGDGHMGSINIPGGVPKSELRRVLKYIETQGLDGMPPLPSLGVVNGNAASAELRPLVDGMFAQLDEIDMMPYEQLDAIARCIIVDKNSPVAAFHKLRHAALSFGDGSPLFSNDEELLARIDECCWRWNGSQFKRVASVIAPFLGQNVDPHTAVRTTILGDGFRTGRAQLKLEYLKELLGGEAQFEAHTGIPFKQYNLQATIDKPLRDALMNSKVAELRDAIIQPDFGKPQPKLGVAL